MTIRSKIFRGARIDDIVIRLTMEINDLIVSLLDDKLSEDETKELSIRFQEKLFMLRLLRDTFYEGTDEK